MRHAVIVQDDAGASQAARTMLADCGIGAEIVCSEIAAWSRISRLPTLDAVFVDITSEQAALGFELAKFARRVIPHISVIYLARDADGSFISALSLPNGEFVEAPFPAGVVAVASAPALEPA